MANRFEKNAQNAAGAYYVDSSCIDCDLCRTVAPGIFKRDDEAGVSYVYHQPITEAEIVQAEEGRGSCPTESIGTDGL